jgi:threonine synthase
VEDSSGNAGASFAAYTSRAGVQARVFIPDAASGPKRAQIAAYGAEITRIMGPRSNAAEAVNRAAEGGLAYASHAYLPHNLPVYATAAYELVEQIGEAPGSVIVPVGQGGLLLGIARGFRAILQAGLMDRLPRLVGVQARACAPLWAVATYGAAGLGFVGEEATVAEGIRVNYPVRGDTVLNTLAELGGFLVAVDEEEILPGREQLARRGFYVEPTSAVIWH